MKQDPTHQILEFKESKIPIQITPHKKKLDSKMTANLWHEQIEIKLFYSEGEELVIGNELFITEKYDIYVINSCEPHSSPKTFSSTDYNMIIIDISKIPTVENSLMNNIISEILTGEIVFNNKIQNSDKLKYLIEELVENFKENGDGFDLKCSGLMFLIIDELVQKYSTRRSPLISRKNIMNYTQKLSPAIEIINDNYAQKIELSTLSEACGLNEKYFCKVFKLLTGMTTIEYINKLRINKAEILILTTDNSLNEIAEICGFSDLSYFSKKFSSIKGYPPTYARKNKRFQ